MREDRAAQTEPVERVDGERRESGGQTDRRQTRKTSPSRSDLNGMMLLLALHESGPPSKTHYMRIRFYRFMATPATVAKEVSLPEIQLEQARGSWCSDGWF